jgi:hypothetical protein
VKKEYGRAFIESLPTVPLVQGTRAEVLDAVARVLNAKGGAR